MRGKLSSSPADSWPLLVFCCAFFFEIQQNSAHTCSLHTLLPVPARAPVMLLSCFIATIRPWTLYLLTLLLVFDFFSPWLRPRGLRFNSFLFQGPQIPFIIALSYFLGKYLHLSQTSSYLLIIYTWAAEGHWRKRHKHVICVTIKTKSPILALIVL